MKSDSEVAQSCPTLCDPMDCSLTGSSVHGIFQARVLEWGAIAFSEPDPWVAVIQDKSMCEKGRGIVRLFQAKGAVSGESGEQNVFSTTIAWRTCWVMAMKVEG